MSMGFQGVLPQQQAWDINDIGILRVSRFLPEPALAANVHGHCCGLDQRLTAVAVAHER